jgi:hypothetical protein
LADRSRHAGASRLAVPTARLPWMIGLAVWESGWRSAAVRTALVALIAIGFMVAPFNFAFVGDGP